VFVDREYARVDADELQRRCDLPAGPAGVTRERVLPGFCVTRRPALDEPRKTVTLAGAQLDDALAGRVGPAC